MMEYKTHIEIPVTVYYDYQPYEAQTRTDPEVFAEITINVVGVNGHDHDMMPQLTKAQVDSLVDQIQESLTQEIDQ